MGRYGCRSYKAEKYAASVNKTFAKYIRTFYARIRVNPQVIKTENLSFVDDGENMDTVLRI